MKPWRVILLVVLTLLLPLRGAVAAAMLCPPGSHGAAVVVAQAAEAGHPDDGEDAHEHHHADVSQELGTTHGETTHSETAHSETCHVCASFCSVTPLLAAMPVVAQPLEAATLSFPDWSAPATVFLSDGQERPPRST